MRPVKAVFSGALAIANVETVITSFIAPANSLRLNSSIFTRMVASRVGVAAVTPTLRIRIGPVTLTGASVSESAIAGALSTANPGNLYLNGQTVIDAVGAVGGAIGEMFCLINAAAAGTFVANCARIPTGAGDIPIDTTIQNLVEMTFISNDPGNTYTIRSASLMLFPPPG